jgi:hypothetical protein
MSKFKVGDRVRVVKVSTIGNNPTPSICHAHLGKEFTVLKVTYGYYLINAPGFGPEGWSSWLESELELVEENKMSKFKIGDKVKVVKNTGNGFYNIYIGKEFEVLEVDEEDETVEINTPDMYNNDSTTWEFSELELAKENKISFLKVDDRERMIKEKTTEVTKTMKTLEMLIAAEANGKTYKNERIYYSKTMGFVDPMNMPWSGYAFIRLNEIIHDDGQYSDGWKEVIKLSEVEKVVAQNLKGKWAARDASGALYTYDSKPEKKGMIWDSNSIGTYSLSALSDLFLMITWEGDAILIEDLLKGEVSQ